jgi:hypothetical protein
MNDAKIVVLSEDVAGMKVGISSIEDKLDGLTRMLNGDGSGGVIGNLQTKDSELSARQDKFENKIQWLTGIWIGSSGVMVVIFSILELLFRK